MSTTTEVQRLARAMTFKNAAAGLSHDSGKAGILTDPEDRKKRASHAYLYKSDRMHLRSHISS